MTRRALFYLILFVMAGAFALLYRGLLLGSDIFTHDAVWWMGNYYYFIESLASGTYPLWDPYTTTGTNFYPYLHVHGLLDPLVFITLIMVKAGVAPLTSYTYLYLFMLVVFGAGAYYLYRQVSGHRLSGLIASGVLVFAVVPPSFRQTGILDAAFLSPFAMYFLLKVFEPGPRRLTYLLALSLCAGVSLNVGLPAPFIFNLVFFTLLLFVMGFAGLDRLKTLVFAKGAAFHIIAALTFAALMAAPAFVLFMESKGAEGEHFPSHRIVQKNNKLYKQVMASDISDDVLASGFTDGLGVYSSSGNVLSRLYPEFHKTYVGISDWGFVRAEWFKDGDRSSEAFQYIGIVPLILAVVGLIYSKSRYRWVAAAMLAVFAVNMLNWRVHDMPPTAPQRFFNFIFPPLKMVETREVLSSFFLLYLCMPLALGLKIILDRGEFEARMAGGWRMFAFVILGALAFKLLIAVAVLQAPLLVTRMDGYAAGFLLLLALAAYLHHRQRLQGVFFYAMIFLAIGVDLFFYNLNTRSFVLQHDSFTGHIRGIEKQGRKGFDWFRVPFIMREYMAFSEAVYKVKGAMSKGDNHHFLTTKRYYDYFTHVPLENQFVLSGIIYPVVRFYPEDAARTLKDRREVLKRLSSAGEAELSAALLLEEGAAERTPISLKGFAGYKDTEWISYRRIVEEYKDLLEMRGDELARNRTAPWAFDGMSGALINVSAFTPNALAVDVRNAAAGYLYYNDGWSRHWRAFDNQTEVPVMAANYNSKAVYLKPGEHNVRFVFDPKPYKAALMLHYAGLAALAGIIICEAASRRLRRRLS